MPKLRSGRISLYILAISAIASSASAMAMTTVGFDGVAHGEIVTDDFAALGIAMINVTNLGGGPHLGVIFDSSNPPTSTDPDLEAPWNLGNLPPSTDLGNLLIVQENAIGCMAGAAPGSAADLCDDPDDEGDRDAGVIELVFSGLTLAFGFDLIDVEDANMDGEGGRVVFHDDDAGTSVTIEWEAYLPGGAFEVAGLAFGDNSANRIPVVTAAELGMAKFDRVEILMGGSGAIDNVVIPEPASGGLLGLGLAAFAARRRARR